MFQKEKRLKKCIHGEDNPILISIHLISLHSLQVTILKQFVSLCKYIHFPYTKAAYYLHCSEPYFFPLCNASYRFFSISL